MTLFNFNFHSIVFKSKLFYAIVPFSCILSGQGIEGKWLDIRQPHELKTPLVQIISFKNDSIANYDFQQEYEKYAVQIKENKIIIEDTITGFYRIKNKNYLEIFAIEDFSNTDNIKSSLVRLNSTIDRDSLAHQIETNSYDFSYKNLDNKIRFNSDLEEEEMIYFGNHIIVANHISIKKWQGIYFLAFHLNRILTYTFPIRQIDSDTIVIYGLPDVKDDVVLYKSE